MVDESIERGGRRASLGLHAIQEEFAVLAQLLVSVRAAKIPEVEIDPLDEAISPESVAKIVIRSPEQLEKVERLAKQAWEYACARVLPHAGQEFRERLMLYLEEFLREARGADRTGRFTVPIPAPRKSSRRLPYSLQSEEEWLRERLVQEARLAVRREAHRRNPILQPFRAECVREAKPLPDLQEHDFRAWQLSQVAGMTQTKIGEALEAQHGGRYGQPRVSRMIQRAKAHAAASGLDQVVNDTSRVRGHVSPWDPHALDRLQLHRDVQDDV